MSISDGLSASLLPTLVAQQESFLDTAIQRLLADLRLLVPCDAVAAWLGHDDRPTLRMALPSDARIPMIDTVRHLVFQAAAEPAHISDLSGLDNSSSHFRSWLGVPLLLDGHRRGWVELWSTRPHRFSDTDLQRAGALVHHAAFGVAQYELRERDRRLSQIDRALMRGLEQALSQTTVERSLQHFLESIVDATGASLASLILPVELAYVLDLKPIAPPPLAMRRQIDDEHLVHVVARSAREAASNTLPASLAIGPSEILLPCVQDDEPIAWLLLQHADVLTAGQIDPQTHARVTGLLTAMLKWMRDHVQREYRAQQSLRMLVQQMHQFRSTTIAELMAGLAHELNNPVSAIVGLSTMLQQDESIAASVRDDLGLIAGEARRIADTVHRMSNFGRPGDMTKAPLQLTGVVADACAVARGLARQRDIELEILLPDESPVVLGNRSQLLQVLVDLLSNALDATEASDQRLVSVTVKTAAQWAAIEIRDTGCGIPQDACERIFAPGFTTKVVEGVRRGLGMGLPMAREIIDNHWGTIDVDSELWKGSRFTVRLPLI